MNTSAISTIRGRSPLPRAQGRGQVPAPVPAPVPTATTRRCSYCGLGGHNRTTCTVRQLAASADLYLQEIQQPGLRDGDFLLGQGTANADDDLTAAATAGAISQGRRDHQPQLRDEGSSMSDEEYETADEEHDSTVSSPPRQTGGTNPLELDWNIAKCMCRRWGQAGPRKGMGKQCCHDRISGSEFCRRCIDMYNAEGTGGPFGRIDQERPIAHLCDGASYEPRGKRIAWKDLS